MKIDKNLCASLYLAFRYIADEKLNFYEGLNHKVFKPIDKNEKIQVKTAQQISKEIKKSIDEFYKPNKTAIFLSGGIDSAILASFLPAKTKAYTFKCIAENLKIDESNQARKYCDLLGLEHEIIEIFWSDFENLSDEILAFDGVPFHSIEVQLLKAARYAKSQSIERIIIGESADLVFGGMDKLIAPKRSFDEFCKRYTFTNPFDVLENSKDISYIYEAYRNDDSIDVLKFMDEIFSVESSSSYMHAFELADIKYLDPYARLEMSEPLDLERIRAGEPKYLLRELFALRYKGFKIPDKIPMPRATNEWLKNYKPKRKEFKTNLPELSGDQKWQLWCLERFFDLHEGR